MAMYRSNFVRILLFVIGLLFAIGLNAFVPISPVAIATEPPQSAQLQKGMERYQLGQYAEAIALWQQLLQTTTNPQARAWIYSNLAAAHRQIGQLDRAIALWQQAIDLSQSLERDRPQIALWLIEQAQAYSDLGQHQQAVSLSKSAIAIAQTNHDLITAAAAQGSLGNAYTALGELEQALAALQASLSLARQLENTGNVKGRTLTVTTLNNLGNLFFKRAERYRFQANSAYLEGDIDAQTRLEKLTQQDVQAAIAAYAQSVTTSKSLGGLAEATALLNFNHVLRNTGISKRSLGDQGTQIAQNRDRIRSLLEAAPNSQDKAYGLISLAVNDQEHGEGQLVAQELLSKAIKVAQAIGDRRSESFALGSLGQIYEATGDYAQAMTLTQQAQFAAQQISALDSLYRWQWQAGRILKATGEKARAIAAYEQAIASLQDIRNDIVIVNKELQYAMCN